MPRNECLHGDNHGDNPGEGDQPSSLEDVLRDWPKDELLASPEDYAALAEAQNGGESPKAA